MGKAKGSRLPFPPASWAFTPWQQEGWDETENIESPLFVGFVAGRGAGKDILAERCILRDALKLYNRRKARLKENKERQARGEKVDPEPERNPLVKIWVVAPQQYNLNQAWDDWRGMLSGLAREWGAVCGFEEDNHEWLFREIVREGKYVIFGRGEIEVEQRLTSTANALRGPGVDLVQWTEAAIETVPGEFARALREELTGTMTRAGRHGRAYFTTSPKGPFGGWWDELKARLKGEGFAQLKNESMLSEDGLTLYRHGESETNTFLSPQQVLAIRAEASGGWQYEQERLARYVIASRGGKTAFARQWVEKCLVDTKAERRGFRRIRIGVDIARFGEDETCFVAVDEDAGEVVRVEFWRQQAGPEVVAHIVRLYAEFPGCTFLVDSTGHRGYVSDYTPNHIPVEETQFSRQKEKWVLGLRMLMQMGRLRIPNPDLCPGMSDGEKEALRKLLRQLLAFSEIVKQGGGIEYSHPPGEHDDGVDGLLLGVMHLANRLAENMGPSEVKKAAARLAL